MRSIDHPRIQIARFSKPSFEFGQENHEIEGVPILVVPVTKTVADCFKYRNTELSSGQLAKLLNELADDTCKKRKGGHSYGGAV